MIQLCTGSKGANGGQGLCISPVWCGCASYKGTLCGKTEVWAWPKLIFDHAGFVFVGLSLPCPNISDNFRWIQKVMPVWIAKKCVSGVAVSLSLNVLLKYVRGCHLTQIMGTFLIQIYPILCSALENVTSLWRGQRGGRLVCMLTIQSCWKAFLLWKKVTAGWKPAFTKVPEGSKNLSQPLSDELLQGLIQSLLLLMAALLWTLMHAGLTSQIFMTSEQEIWIIQINDNF